jgi:hypothetical protein
MKINLFLRTVILLFLCQVSITTFAQQKGEVQDQEFVIRKDRVLTLPKQVRTLERIPSLPTPKSSNTFSYNVQPFFLNLPPNDIEAVASQKTFRNSTQEYFPGFIRAGFGNYQSPLIEGRYNYSEDNYYDVGVKLFHQGFYTGPISGRNSAEDQSNFTLNGSLFKDYYKLMGGITYDRHMFHYYGYVPENENLIEFLTPQNVFNTFKINAAISSNEKMSPFNYFVETSGRRFNDQFKASESEYLLKATSDFWIKDQIRLGGDLNISLTNTSDVLYNSLARNYLKFHPSVRFVKDGLDVTAGVNLIVENDAFENKNSDTHIFPFLSATFMLSDEIGVFVGYKGDVIRNTYLGFVNENQFLGPSGQLLNTVQKYQVEAGLKGILNNELTYQAGIRFGDYSNMHFYSLNDADSLKFNLIYDRQTKVLNYFAQMTYSRGKQYQLVMNGNYYHYQLSNLQGALHRPEWEFLINNNFMPTSKWLVQGNAKLMGGIQGTLVSEDLPASVLPAIIDLQVKVDYKITDRATLFIEGNNLLNRKNQRFINYPVRGIQGIIGASFKF